MFEKTFTITDTEHNRTVKLTKSEMITIYNALTANANRHKQDGFIASHYGELDIAETLQTVVWGSDPS